MNNLAILEYNASFEIYSVKVNDLTVYGNEDKAKAELVVKRLNRIFGDENRDLDFITPSFAAGKYIVCCPRVRLDIGEQTYLYDASNGARGWRSYPAKLYEPTNWVDSELPSKQTAILEIEESSKAPWYNALVIANSIRAAIKLNYPAANGNESCKQLNKPNNISSDISIIISEGAHCEYYGVPCQGTRPGRTSPCPEIGFDAGNILNPFTEIGEVFHPQDLTAAITPSYNWHGNYMNMFIKVTNLADPSKSIVVRVTDRAPARKGIELTYRAWVEIGRPVGTNSVRLELMK